MTLIELIPEVEQLSASDKLKLIRVLAENFDAAQDIAPLVPHKTYHLYTPYDCIGAGAALMSALNASEEESR
jgi:hypothetical protein